MCALTEHNSLLRLLFPTYTSFEVQRVLLPDFREIEEVQASL